MSNGSGPLTRFARLFGRQKPEEAPLETANDALELVDRVPLNAIGGTARFQIGQVVRHRLFPFRGVIFDVDPVFANTDEWYEAIPEEVRPHKNQPYYHLFAENEKTHYIAYVSEQNLEADESRVPVAHPDIPVMFEIGDGGYVLKADQAN